jgi:hypothetical protein
MARTPLSPTPCRFDRRAEETMKRFAWIGTALFLFAGMALPAAADTLIRQHVHTGAIEMMGQSRPAQDDTVSIWLSKDRLAVSGGGNDVIVRLDLNQLYLLDHDKKAYSALALPIDLTKILPADDPNAPMLAQMIEMMKSTTTLTPTEEHKKVGPWNARRYNMETKNNFLTLQGVLWATTEAPIDPQLYRTLQENLLSLNPALRDALASMRKIEGVVVLQEQNITAMGATTSILTETLEIKEGSAPADVYRVPKEYAKQDFNPLENMR